PPRATTMDECDRPAVEAHRDYLMLLARLHLRRAPIAKLEASDVVQQTLLEAHRTRHQFRGNTGAERAGWLRKMLAWHLTDAAAAAGGRKRNAALGQSLEVVLRDSSARLGAWLAADGSTPSQRAERDEEADRLPGLLGQLKESQREALILRHYEGCAIDEI